MSVIRERIKDLRDAITDWIELATDYEFIEDDQYAPGPTDTPYFTFSLPSGITKVGRDDSILYSAARESFVQAGLREMTVSIKARGLPRLSSRDELLRGTDMLAELEWTLDRPEIKSIFARRQITVISREPIVETSAVEGNVLMPRGAFDLRVSMSISEEISLDYIERVEIRGSVDSQLDGSFSTDIGPFTIPEEE